MQNCTFLLLHIQQIISLKRKKIQTIWKFSWISLFLMHSSKSENRKCLSFFQFQHIFCCIWCDCIKINTPTVQPLRSLCARSIKQVWMYAHVNEGKYFSAQSNSNRIPNVSVEHGKYFYYINGRRVFSINMLLRKWWCYRPVRFLSKIFPKLNALIPFLCFAYFWKYLIVVIIVTVVAFFYNVCSIKCSKKLRKVHWVNVRLGLHICNEF